MTLNEMKNNVIRTYGFEHPATLYFFDACEIDSNDMFLNEICYEFAMNWDNVENVIGEE